MSLSDAELARVASLIHESAHADWILDRAVTFGVAPTVADLETRLRERHDLCRCSCCNRFRKARQFYGDAPFCRACQS